ncbi:Ppx/GppA family phosphatase [Kineosporia sp. J2-2]|uniref:Ppx/GppA family phosphatase n=1 Tax=Kineosporia corallincola TaxID=2835133 RepID=A0ABS5TBB4_9ACTN|nr:Ppx/GppA phosphatase family protein [Kineosporia corallincola]MBT0767729.1 Ppx/GppA family phosphatase [Kineosporia corallincola]
MRLGVLDVGSNTVHLLVVDAHPGARPLPASSHKVELKLAEQLEADGRISAAGEKALLEFVGSSLTVGEDLGVEEVIGFATSAIRDAPNGQELLNRVRTETGVELRVLAGGDEARLTFLAVRRWFGWSAGRLLVLDIGGGSLEIGAGLDELPDVAISLPLGAGRLTRDRLAGDPPDAESVRSARRYVRAEIGRVVRDVVRGGVPDQVVGSSKTFRTLARICTPMDDEGPARTLRRADLSAWVPRLAAMTESERSGLPGVSTGRARQILAGALVAEGAMELLGVESLQISPWALREGVILRRLDAVMSASGPGL